MQAHAIKQLITAACFLHLPFVARPLRGVGGERLITTTYIWQAAAGEIRLLDVRAAGGVDWIAHDTVPQVP